jgi:hypothetical protein
MAQRYNLFVRLAYRELELCLALAPQHYDSDVNILR